MDRYGQILVNLVLIDGNVEDLSGLQFENKTSRVV
jgi:hypothetical protein